MKLLVAAVLLSLAAALVHSQGMKPPVLPLVKGTKEIRAPGELPTLKLISRDHQSYLTVKQTADGFTLSILKIPSIPSKMK